MRVNAYVCARVRVELGTHACLSHAVSLVKRSPAVTVTMKVTLGVTSAPMQGHVKKRFPQSESSSVASERLLVRASGCVVVLGVAVATA